jgi:nucleoside-diphosphate-sugar epimerase
MVKTALVTGSAGFLGRHFVEQLQRGGWSLTGCDPRGWDGHDALDLFRDDTTVYDLVIHCAAREPHRAAIDGHPAGVAYNIQLDAAMFDWALRTKQHRVLYLSSSAAYPVNLQADVADARLLRETDIRTGDVCVGNPDAGYGWAKLTGERMATAAAAEGLAVHVVRPFSGYGEDQGENWPFGAFVARAKQRDNPFTVWGPGTQVRDWIHVDDLVAAALAVVDGDVREPVNICTGMGTSMAELVAMFAAEVGYKPKIELHTDRPAGVAHRVGDPIRLNTIYQPRITLAEGVKRAVAA